MEKIIRIDVYNRDGLLIYGGSWQSDTDSCGSNEGFMFVPKLKAIVVSSRGVCNHWKEYVE